MLEDAGAADVIAGGRLQLGISRGSPEQVIDGWRYLATAPIRRGRCGDGPATCRRILELLRGKGFAKPNPRPMFRIRKACCALSHTLQDCVIESGGGLLPTRPRYGSEVRNEPAELNSQFDETGERYTSNRPRRFAPFAQPGRKLVTSALRVLQLAAVFFRCSMTVIDAISDKALVRGGQDRVP